MSIPNHQIPYSLYSHLDLNIFRGIRNAHGSPEYYQKSNHLASTGIREEPRQINHPFTSPFFVENSAIEEVGNAISILEENIGKVEIHMKESFDEKI